MEVSPCRTTHRIEKERERRRAHVKGSCRREQRIYKGKWFRVEVGSVGVVGHGGRSVGPEENSNGAVCACSRENLLLSMDGDAERARVLVLAMQSELLDGGV
jgi:hypothetical protein